MKIGLIIFISLFSLSAFSVTRAELLKGVKHTLYDVNKKSAQLWTSLWNLGSDSAKTACEHSTEITLQLRTLKTIFKHSKSASASGTLSNAILNIEDTYDFQKVTCNRQTLYDLNLEYLRTELEEITKQIENAQKLAWIANQ